MARFLFATMPVPGHVAPITPVARAPVERGHDVVWYGSKYHADSIVRSGASFRPIRSTVDYGDGRYDAHFPDRDRLRGAILTILGDPGFRTRAALIQTDFARHDAPAEAADLLERLANTQQPVLRA